ncbi:MAG: DUF58 domain-containing protein [Planctomycetota bacterium]|nr:DUF58 domain-containing protein [Planctomycetota bacterium]
MVKLFQNSQTDVPLEDPSALAKFGKLEVVARLVVEGFIMGQHKSPYKGASIEFIEHRQYYPGDEIRHIDWRAFGKTGKYYVKEFEDETNLRCYLVVDASGSMGYGASTLTKFEYARQLAASMGHLLLKQRDATGLITFDTRIRDRIDPSTNPKTFRRMVHALMELEVGEETSMTKVLTELLPTVKRRSLIVIISDCFDQIDPLMEVLKRYRHSRHEVVLFQIVTPEEEDFPFTRPTRFHNLERADHHVLVDPHRLRQHYLEQYNEFCNGLARFCASSGIDHEKMLTTEPYHKALGAYLNVRTRKKKKK